MKRREMMVATMGGAVMLLLGGCRSFEREASYGFRITHVWLLDVIAGDRNATISVLANFRPAAGEQTVKSHPTVARLINPAVFEQLRGAASA